MKRETAAKLRETVNRLADFRNAPGAISGLSMPQYYAILAIERSIMAAVMDDPPDPEPATITAGPLKGELICLAARCQCLCCRGAL